jgi:PAS domain S-box-containing protein
VGYAVCFWGLYPIFGRAGGGLLVLPILLATSFYGLAGAVTYALFGFAANTGILLLIGYEGALMGPSRLLALAATLLFGVVSGYVKQNMALRRENRRRRQAEELYRSLVENANDIIYTLDSNGVFRYVSPNWTKTLGHPIREVTGHGFQRFVPEEDQPRCHGFLRSVLETGAGSGFEYRVRHADGSLRWHVTNAAAVRFDGEMRFLGVARDLTERKIREENLLAMMREKELLLQEVRHRVKNNLQLMLSLLSLQRRTVTDGTSAVHLFETENRIRTLSLVHELLYGAEDMSRIDAATYLSAVTAQLRDALQSTQHGISIDPRVSSVTLPVDVAIPIGLIVNELVTNAVKHAFSGQGGGTVRVEFGPAEDGFELVVEDNGNGPPDSFGPGRRSLGSMLVTSLSNQLDGTWRVSGKKGTRVTISVPAAAGEADMVRDPAQD